MCGKRGRGWRWEGGVKGQVGQRRDDVREGSVVRPRYSTCGDVVMVSGCGKIGPFSAAAARVVLPLHCPHPQSGFLLLRHSLRSCHAHSWVSFPVWEGGRASLVCVHRLAKLTKNMEVAKARIARTAPHFLARPTNAHTLDHLTAEPADSHRHVLMKRTSSSNILPLSSPTPCVQGNAWEQKKRGDSRLLRLGLLSKQCTAQRTTGQMWRGLLRRHYGQFG